MKKYSFLDGGNSVLKSDAPATLSELRNGDFGITVKTEKVIGVRYECAYGIIQIQLQK